MTDKPAPIRIVICDDAEAATQSDWERLHKYAQEDGGASFAQAGLAVCGMQAISQGRSRAADLVLVDLVMPRLEGERRVLVGPWVARALTAYYESEGSPFKTDGSVASDPRPPAPKLALWTSNPLETVRCEVHAFVSFGGRGVVDKQASTQKQVETIRRIASGEERWQPDNRLTRAQREMLAYLDAGYTLKDVAAALFITEKGVEDRSRALRDALGVPSGGARGAGPTLRAARAQGVSWVPLRYGAVPPDDDPLAFAD